MEQSRIAVENEPMQIVIGNNGAQQQCELCAARQFSSEARIS